MRIIHACGMTEIARDIVDVAGLRRARARRRCWPARRSCAIRRWWRNGITRARLPADNAVDLHARRSRGAGARAQASPTRARRPRWNCGGDRLAGAVVAIGNAPTALFRLLEMLDAGAPPPAAVIGLPVGFVGAHGIQGGAGGRRARAVPDRARPQGRQRHGGGRGQRAGERAANDRPRHLGGNGARAARSTASASGRATCAISRCAPPAWCAPSMSSPTSPRSGLPGNARRIVAPLIDDGPRRAALRISRDRRDAGRERRLSAADRRVLSRDGRRAGRRCCAQGKSVGLLAEGDPFFYGSFMHMWRRLAADFPVEVVPGVTGMSGCWTRANLPITWGNDTLAVLPGTLDEDAARRAPAPHRCRGDHEGRPQPRQRCGAPSRRRACCRARSMSSAAPWHDERILPLADCGEPVGAYFAMVLIPGEGRRL